MVVPGPQEEILVVRIGTFTKFFKPSSLGLYQEAKEK